MRKILLFLTIFIAFSSVLMFAGCTKNGGGVVEGAEDIHISFSADSYDFMQGVTADSVDASDVEFGKPGSYTVKYKRGKETKEVSVYIYGTPVFSGGDATVSYADALGGTLDGGLTAKDTFGNELDLQFEPLAKNQLGVLDYKSYAVEYTAVDRVGNIGSFSRNLTVSNANRLNFTDKTVDLADASLVFYFQGLDKVSLYIDGDATADFTARNGYLSFGESLLTGLALNTDYNVTVAYSMGWSQFSLTVTDNAPLAYELDTGKAFYFSEGDIVLPTVKVSTAQSYSVNYYFGKGSAQPADGNIIEDVKAGSYSYSVEVMRKGGLVIKRDYAVKVLDGLDMLSVIDKTESAQFLDRLNFGDVNTWAFAGEIVGRTANKFTGYSADVSSNTLTFGEEMIKNLLEQGMEFIEFYARTDEDGDTTVKAAARWGLTDKEGEATAFGGTWKKITVNLKELTKDAGGDCRIELRFSKGEIYLSDITATGNIADNVDYEGMYTHADGEVEISGNNAHYGGQTYALTITKNNVIRLKNATDIIFGEIYSDIIILNGEFYAGGGIGQKTGIFKLPELAKELTSHGYETEYYLADINGGAEQILESLVFDAEPGKYIFRTKIYSDGVLKAVIDKEFDVLTADEYGSITDEAFYRALSVNKSSEKDPISAVTTVKSENLVSSEMFDLLGVRTGYHVAGTLDYVQYKQNDSGAGGKPSYQFYSPTYSYSTGANDGVDMVLFGSADLFAYARALGYRYIYIEFNTTLNGDIVCFGTGDGYQRFSQMSGTITTVAKQSYWITLDLYDDALLEYSCAYMMCRGTYSFITGLYFYDVIENEAEKNVDDEIISALKAERSSYKTENGENVDISANLVSYEMMSILPIELADKKSGGTDSVVYRPTGAGYTEACFLLNLSTPKDVQNPLYDMVKIAGANVLLYADSLGYGSFVFEFSCDSACRVFIGGLNADGSYTAVYDENLPAGTAKVKIDLLDILDFDFAFFGCEGDSCYITKLYFEGIGYESGMQAAVIDALKTGKSVTEDENGKSIKSGGLISAELFGGLGMRLGRIVANKNDFIEFRNNPLPEYHAYLPTNYYAADAGEDVDMIYFGGTDLWEYAKNLGYDTLVIELSVAYAPSTWTGVGGANSADDKGNSVLAGALTAGETYTAKLGLNEIFSLYKYAHITCRGTDLMVTGLYFTGTID